MEHFRPVFWITSSEMAPSTTAWPMCFPRILVRADRRFPVRHDSTVPTPADAAINLWTSARSSLLGFAVTIFFTNR